MGGLSDTNLTAPGVTTDNSTASDESSDDSTSGSKKSKSSDTPDSADPGDINAQAVELKGMDAVVEYAKELWYGSHIINVKLDDSDGSDSTAEIEYKTTAFGSLFSQPRALSRQVNVISSSSMDSTYGTYDFGDATAQEKGYYLLRKEGGFTHEAACGIMGNISVESGDDWDVHCVTGENVGLFQNSQDELAAMKKFCSENNLDFYSVEGQIRGGIYSLQEVSMPHYSELESKLKDPSVYKDEAGAISAANDWAAVYERCVGSLGKSKVYAGTFSQYNGKTYQGLKTREERAAEFYKKFLQYKDNLDGLGITETGMMDASALMTDGVMNVPYLNQAAGWLDGNNLFSKDITLPNGNEYGGGDMQSSGCSLCSTAMIMSYAKGQRYSPNDKHFTKYFSNDRANMAYNVAQDLGLSAMWMTNKQTDKVISELKAGHPVFTHLKDGVTAVTTDGEKLGPWSSTSGHFIVLIGYKKVDGKDAVAVADPGHKNHAYAVSHKWFPLSNIVSALKTSKPFTSVSPSPELLGASSGDMSLMQKSVIAYCKQKLGSPYQYGACHSEAQIKSNDTSKFDCSGYVNWVFTHATGKLYNYSSDGWASAGTPIDVHELQPGDVLAKKGSPGHVAIYAGNNKMYEAPSSGGKVHLTAFRNEFTYFRRIVAGSPLLASSSGSGSIMIKSCGKTKKYTNAQFVAQIQKLSLLGTGAGWCGRWTSRAWGAMLDGTTTKYNSAFSQLGADAYAYSKDVEFHKTSDVSSIPVGADVFWSDSSGGAGHIGIYIGGGKYISNIGHGTPSVRNVLGSNDGLNGDNYHFEGWGWHTRNGKQVVFPA
jgi:cell wall-associated NlpC family hydrolase